MNDLPIIAPALATRIFALRTLRPTTPIFAWLAQLDDALAAMPTIFGDRRVVLDLTAAALHGPGTRALVGELQMREFRVIGLSGLGTDALGPEAPRLPPILVAEPGEASAGGSAAVPAVGRPVVIARNVRSGQEVGNPAGDVIVVGSVSSGAEVVAAGSIHVYGVLQGRAFAGVAGTICCQKLEAELLRIGDLFVAADDMPTDLRGHPARAWRDGDIIHFAALT